MPSSRTVRILYVDDEPSTADTGPAFLERQREWFDVVPESNPVTVRSRLEDGQFDCVVSAYEMSPVDGLEVLADVRAWAADIPFILVTGSGSEAVASQAISAGVTDYLRANQDTDQYATLANRIENAVDQHKSHELQEAILANISDAIITIDATSTIQFASPAVENIFGYSPAELVGNPLTTVMPASHQNDHLDGLARYLETGNRSVNWDDVQIVGEHRDGHTIPLSIAYTEFTFDGDPHFAGVIRDVTERRKREQRLKESTETLTRLHEETQRLLHTNTLANAADIAVTSIATVLGMEIATLWLYDEEQDALVPTASTDAATELLASLPTYQSDGESLSWEAYVTNTTRVIDTVHEHETRHNPESPIRSEIILPLGSHGVLNIGATESHFFDQTDVTLAEIWATTIAHVFTRLDREERLREREEELTRERNRLDDFSSFVSHDLRNPLNLAIGRMDLVADECDSEHLEDVVYALNRMERLVDDLLTLAREGETGIEPTMVDLGAVARSCWDVVETGSATLDIQTTMTIHADENSLKQLLENLFRNSVEHSSTSSQASPDNSVEHSSTSNQTSPHNSVEHSSIDDSEGYSDTSDRSSVSITVGQLEDGSGFYVEDTGPGIPEADREQIFEVGYSTAAEGTGFGLAIVATIAAAHDWTIDVTDGTDGGARFEITGVETR